MLAIFQIHLDSLEHLVPGDPKKIHEQDYDLLSEIGAIFFGFRRFNGLPVAADGCLGVILGQFSALVGVGSGVAPKHGLGLQLCI